MPTSKKSPSSRASRNIYVEETINTRMLESLYFGGGPFYLVFCKKKGGEKAQPTKTDVVVFSAQIFFWGEGGGGVSWKDSHFYLNMSSMKQIKCTIYVDYPRIWTWTLPLGKARVNIKNKLAIFQVPVLPSKLMQPLQVSKN
jgi:hypothetical protein